MRAGSNSVRQQFPGVKGARVDEADKQIITGGTTLIFPREPFLHRSQVPEISLRVRLLVTSFPARMSTSNWSSLAAELANTC